MIDWKGAKVVDEKTDVGFKEAIWIRKIAPTIKRDEEPTD